MPNQAHDSDWSGRTRRASFKLATVLFMAGCATRQVTDHDAVYDLQYLQRALNASPAGREAMWRDTEAEARSFDSSIRTALMQSVPDHSGYDPVAAQHTLRGVIAQSPSPGIVALAQVRLDEIRSNSLCYSQNQELRHRLAQVVEIDRNLDGKAH